MVRILILLTFLIVVSCSIQEDDITGVYEPVTIGDFSSNLIVQTHLLEVDTLNNMFIVHDKEKFSIGTYYDKKTGSGDFIWKYQEIEIPAKFITSKGDTLIRIAKNTDVFVTYKKISTKANALKILPKKTGEKWLN